MTRVWSVARGLGGVAILALLVGRVGTGPFLDGVRLLDPRSLAAAAAIGAAATASGAWRWTLVARGLGVPLSLADAVTACYRAQFLNTTLPGGVVGDVHRAVRHGRRRRRPGPGPAGGRLGTRRRTGRAGGTGAPGAPAAAVAGARADAGHHGRGGRSRAVLWLLARGLSRSGPSLAARSARALRCDLRRALLVGTAWPGILLASLVAVTAHVATFLLAARAAGSAASAVLVLPLALLVLLAMGLPANVAGWGPREGVAAWAFASAGLGAAWASRRPWCTASGPRRQPARGRRARRRVAAPAGSGAPRRRTPQASRTGRVLEGTAHG